MALPIDIQIHALIPSTAVSKWVGRSDEEGDYVTSDTRAPRDEVEEGEDHKDADTR